MNHTRKIIIISTIFAHCLLTVDLLAKGEKFEARFDTDEEVRYVDGSFTITGSNYEKSNHGLLVSKDGNWKAVFDPPITGLEKGMLAIRFEHHIVFTQKTDDGLSISGNESSVNINYGSEKNLKISLPAENITSGVEHVIAVAWDPDEDGLVIGVMFDGSKPVTRRLYGISVKIAVGSFFIGENSFVKEIVLKSTP